MMIAVALSAIALPSLQCLNSEAKEAEQRAKRETSIQSSAPTKLARRTELHNDANQLIRAGQFEQAIDTYEKALAIKDDAALRARLGDMLAIRQQFDRSIAQYKKAARIHNSAELQTKLGSTYYADKEWTSAITHFSNALRLNPQDPITKEILCASIAHGTQRSTERAKFKILLKDLPDECKNKALHLDDIEQTFNQNLPEYWRKGRRGMDLLIHKSGLILKATPHWGPWVTEVGCVKKHQLDSDGIKTRVRQVTIDEWKRPYSQVKEPDEAQKISLEDFSVSDRETKQSRNVTTVDVFQRFSDVGFTFSDDYVKEIPVLIEQGKASEIADIIMDQDHPENVPFVLVKNIWMKMANGAIWKNKIDISAFVNVIPPSWLNNPQDKDKILESEDKINSLLENISHPRTPTLDSMLEYPELRNHLADIVRKLIDACKSTNSQPFNVQQSGSIPPPPQSRLK